MSELLDPFHTLKTLNGNKAYQYYSLPEFEKKEKCSLQRLPISIRVMLESLLRNCDGKRVKEEHVRALAAWNAKKPQDLDVPFVVARVILQDFTGVPLLVDLAAMRDAVAQKGIDPESIEPQVPVDLIVDHSVQVDLAGSDEAFAFNLKMEFKRNLERYAFLKWGQEAFQALKVFPPGIGIVHQVNLEHLAQVVITNKKDGFSLLYPDTLVGTDSHTTMINGLGVVGWGVGGIEAEAGMLGQPIYLQMPEVIGFLLEGSLKEGVTATDLTLHITEILRQEKVVGKFVEFFGEGAASLSVADRATIGNMAPEYGATIGYFPVDDRSLEYLEMTGRDAAHIHLVKEYLKSQQLFGIPKRGEIDFTKILELNLSEIQPSVSGPKRPQDRLNLGHLKPKFKELLSSPIQEGGYGKMPDSPKQNICVHVGGAFSLNVEHETGGKPYIGANQVKIGWSEEEMVTNRPLTPAVNPPKIEEANELVCDMILSDGSIVIAAITSCTNTSNPSVMIAAGLLAKKAHEKGLTVNPKIKTSLAPGSRVVTDYLNRTGLQKYLDAFGFQLVGYGCTTCIGNSGPLEEHIEQAIKNYDLITASVLSGNRNFEARIHSSVKANFLMSPPLVVAFAIAGRVDIDLNNEPLGYAKDGQPVYLREIWPSSQEIKEAISIGVKPELFKQRYANVMNEVPEWQEIKVVKSAEYQWDEKSSYIQNPPYFENFALELPQISDLKNMRALAIFGDSVTTDHISPAGAIRKDSPAGKYLLSLGVNERDFNSYGSRRGNHNIMMRGTFANVRTRNKMADGLEGGYTKLMPEGKIMSIFEASEIYHQRKTPLIILAGKDYGMGSSRDWAAKGTALLGVNVVVANSFERIHRNNLIGMGVLPLQFRNGESAEELGITGNEVFSIVGLKDHFSPQQEFQLEISSGDKKRQITVTSRLDTQSEIEYYRHGGILPFVLRQMLTTNK
jgi:aconitate hydratase